MIHLDRQELNVYSPQPLLLMCYEVNTPQRFVYHLVTNLLQTLSTFHYFYLISFSPPLPRLFTFPLPHIFIFTFTSPSSSSSSSSSSHLHLHPTSSSSSSSSFSSSSSYLHLRLHLHLHSHTLTSSSSSARERSENHSNYYHLRSISQEKRDERDTQ